MKYPLNKLTATCRKHASFLLAMGYRIIRADIPNAYKFVRKGRNPVLYLVKSGPMAGISFLRK